MTTANPDHHAPLPPCADCGHDSIHLAALGCLGGDGTCICPTHVPPLPAVVSSPTLDRARVERDAAMAQVAEHTDPEWLAQAERAVGHLAALREPFTADSVWEQLAARQVPAPREPRALGPVMKRAVRDGVIRWTGNYDSSTRRHCTPVRVYVGAR